MSYLWIPVIVGAISPILFALFLLYIRKYIPRVES